MKKYLARFRADPRKVRIRVRRLVDRNEWEVGIFGRSRTGDGVGVWESHKYPTRALVLALRRAEEENLAGLDLPMSWAYDHPWGALGRDVSEVDVPDRGAA